MPASAWTSAPGRRLYSYSNCITPDKAAYLRNCLDTKTQLNYFLCVQKHNKNSRYSILNFFIAYDALRLPFLYTTLAIVGYTFIHGMVQNLVH